MDSIRNKERRQLKLRIPEDDLSEDELFVLPQELFTNSSFRELRFSMCSLMPKGVVCWKLLKTLSIGYVQLHDGVIDEILEGSPVLENLELYYFYGFAHLHITKASLENLILREFWGLMDIYEGDGGIFNEFWDFDLEISTPNLQSLDISGFLGSMDVSSLVDTNLNCYLTSHVHDVNDEYEWHQNVLRGLLESLVHVKNLTLGSWALRVLSIMEMKGLPSPLSKCECFNTKYVHCEICPPWNSKPLGKFISSRDVTDNLNVLFVPFLEGDFSLLNSSSATFLEQSHPHPPF